MQNNAATIGNPSFPTLIAVWHHLTAQGWKISQSGIYNHQKAGKILPDGNGTYSMKAVDTYVNAWLKPRASGKLLNERIEDLQRRISERDREHSEAEPEQETLSLEDGEKQYIEKSLLDAAMTDWIRTESTAWIHLAGGDPEKASDLITSMTQGKDELLNRLASLEIIDESGK